MKNKTSDLGKTLTAEREKRGLSLRQASALTGISHTYLSALEKGHDPRSGKTITPTPDVIFKICKAYELDFSAVLPVTGFHDENAFFSYIAGKIRDMKDTDPRRYKELLDIITEEKKDKQ